MRWKQVHPRISQHCGSNIRKQGKAQSPATPLTQFFGPTPQASTGPPRAFTDFLSDPRCYFDRQTARFFFTVIQIDVAPSTGDLGRAHLELAVSKTPDPRGQWYLFAIDLTD